MEEYKKILYELHHRKLLSDDMLYDSMKKRLLAIHEDELLRLKKEFQRLKEEHYTTDEDWNRLKKMVTATFGNPSS